MAFSTPMSLSMVLGIRFLNHHYLLNICHVLCKTRNFKFFQNICAADINILTFQLESREVR
jgi:hypothetical protein